MNKIAIVIFNKNYDRFSESLFEGLKSNNIINNSKFHVFYCDDGSSDDSLKTVNDEIKLYGIGNMSIINTTEKGYHRDIFSHGQIEGLAKVIDSIDNKYNYLALLDSDDYYPDFYWDQVNEEIYNSNKMPDLFFSKVMNVDETGNSLGYSPIKRLLSKGCKLWPSVTPTSGIIVKSDFIIKNYRSLFNMEAQYSDVWLDSRLHLLAMSENAPNVQYLGVHICRLIHGDNDSRNINYKRIIKKQIQAGNYLRTIARFKADFFTRLTLIRLLSPLGKWI